MLFRSYLREGIGLRGWAQRDPLVEYQREGYDMFNTMMDGIKEESVGSLFNLQVEVQQDPIVAEEAEEAGALGTAQAPALGGGTGAHAAGRGSRGQAAPDQAIEDRRGQGRGSSRSGAGQRGAGQGGSGQGGSGQAGSGQAGSGRGGQHRQGQAAQAQVGGQSRGRHASASAAPAEDDLPAGLSSPGLARPQRSGQLSYTAPAEDGSGTAERHTSSAPGEADYSKVGRNSPCPCGSGRKFKQCHGDPRNR